MHKLNVSDLISVRIIILKGFDRKSEIWVVGFGVFLFFFLLTWDDQMRAYFREFNYGKDSKPL